MTEFVPTATESYRVQHLSRPDDLTVVSDVPGRNGQSLCRVNNLYGVIDQDRADFWTRGFAKQPVIANLPQCKRCERAAARIEAGESR